MNIMTFQEGVGPDFGRVLQEGLIDIFIEEIGEEDTREDNANKNGEIWFTIIE